MIPFQQFLGGHCCNKGHSLWYKSLTLFPPPLTFLIWAPLVPVEPLNASSASLLPKQACLTWEAAPCAVAEYWTNIRTALALPGALRLLPLFCFLDEGKQCHRLLPESPGCPPNKDLSLQLRLLLFFFFLVATKLDPAGIWEEKKESSVGRFSNEWVVVSLELNWAWNQTWSYFGSIVQRDGKCEQRISLFKNALDPCLLETGCFKWTLPSPQWQGPMWKPRGGQSNWQIDQLFIHKPSNWES